MNPEFFASPARWNRSIAVLVVELAVRNLWPTCQSPDYPATVTSLRPMAICFDNAVADNHVRIRVIPEGMFKWMAHLHVLNGRLNPMSLGNYLAEDHMTFDQRIDDLLARDAIQDLGRQYAHSMYTGDYETTANLFAEDGYFTTGNIQDVVCRGKEQLLDFYRGNTQSELQSRPFLHSHIIKLKGDDHATGTLYIECRSATQGMRLLGSGFYDDEYVKVNGEWKIKSRIITMLAWYTVEGVNDVTHPVLA